MSYQEKMEGLQRRADIASSRANPERRQMARDSMKNFFGKLFKGGNKKAKGGGRQYFGSSPLQQAIAQREAGILTPQGAELLKGMEQNPDEMARQEALMGQGRHGDYGVNRKATPYYTDATTEQLSGGQQGPPKSIAGSDGQSNPSATAQAGDVEGTEQRLMLDRFMEDPSKLNAEGVKSMQTMLNSLGFKDKNGKMLQVDGKMGALTASAMENYRGQYGQGANEQSEPLAPEKVVRGFNQNNVAGAEGGAFSPQNQWNPYAMETQSQWDIVNQGHGGKGQEAGYFDIQNTIGNPANSPIMWGENELSEATNPLQYDRELGEVLPPYR